MNLINLYIILFGLIILNQSCSKSTCNFESEFYVNYHNRDKQKEIRDCLVLKYRKGVKEFYPMILYSNCVLGDYDYSLSIINSELGKGNIPDAVLYLDKAKTFYRKNYPTDSVLSNLRQSKLHFEQILERDEDWINEGYFYTIIYLSNIDTNIITAEFIKRLQNSRHKDQISFLNEQKGDISLKNMQFDCAQ